MAELTNLESKLAEVLGLAQAAQGTVRRVQSMLGDEDEQLAAQLAQTLAEAEETEERTTALVSGLDGRKTAILDAARETKGEATEMMETYLEGEEDALDGYEFLTMAEAAEVGHWAIVQKMAGRGSVAGAQELADWALPVQQRHFQQALDGSLKLAEQEDPDEVAE